MARDIDLYNRNVGRGSRIPNIGIGAGYGGFAPATFQAAVFTPEKEDMSLLQRSLTTLDERKERTDQQRAAITAALSKVKLNEADSEWKYNFINDISKQIDAAAQFGDYSSALERATVLAGEAASNPELLARAERNEQYQLWRKDIESRAIEGKIDRRTADRLLEQNEYNFIPRYDKNGNVVGGYNWNDTGGINGGPAPVPVNKISLEAIFKAVDSIVAAHKGGGAGYTARDAEGNEISLYGSKADTYTKSSSSWEEKRLSDLKAVFNELVDQHPEIGAYVAQMKDDDIWEIQKLEAENRNNPENKNYDSNQQKLTALRSKVYTKNGLGYVTDAEYLNNMSKKSVESMAYRNTISDVSLSGGGSSRTTGQQGDGTGPLRNTTFTGIGTEESQQRDNTHVSSVNVADLINKKFKNQ